MTIESPNAFEKEPISKDVVVEALKEKGMDDAETVALLEEFTRQLYARFQNEGRVDAYLESLREKAHALRLAGNFADAISVITVVADTAKSEGDEESHKEAASIISWLVSRVMAITDMTFSAPMELDKTGENISKEKVFEALKPLASKASDPALLDANDPEVVAATELYNTWSAQQESATQNNDILSARHNLDKTMMYVDAGFHDPIYLDEVLGWLYQDADNLDKDPDNPDLVALRKDLAQAMQKVRGLLGTES